MTTWATSSSRRRSNRSASAPARTAKNSSGKVDEAVIAATHSGEPVSSNISHEAATAWRNEPRLEITDAAHSARNRRTRRGSMAETDMFATVVPVCSPPAARRCSEIAGRLIGR